MTTIAPKKITLTCTVTGKQTIWTNQQIIQKKIDEFGSLEAFMAQYVSRGANKSIAQKVQEPKMMEQILKQGVELGKMSHDEYTTKYVTRKYVNKDGTITTVTAPAMPQSKFTSVNETLHAAAAAQKAVDAIAS